jgi:hypothetical protein
VKAVDTVLQRMRRIASNQGHLRVSIIGYAVWVALSLWLVWRPLPQPVMTEGDAISSAHVAACDPISINGEYERCAAAESRNIAGFAILDRIVFVLLTPFAAIFILAVIAIGFEWVKDGYHNSN